MKKQTSLHVNMLFNAIKGVISVIFPLISFPYISKVLGVDNIGNYNFANSIITYFIFIAGLGINTYAVREGARIRNNEEDFQKFANEIFTINIISTIISYALLFVSIIAVARFEQSKVLLLILSLQIVFKTIGFEWIFIIYEEFKFITIQSIIFQLFSLVLMFSFIKNSQDTSIYVAIVAFSSVGSNLMNYFYSKQFCRVRITPNINFKKHIKPIMILFGMSITVTIYVSSDITILGFLCSDRIVGIYSVSAKVYGIIKTILSSVLIVAIPRLALFLGKNDKTNFNLLAINTYHTLLSLGIPAIVGMIILKKQIVTLISSHEFIDATSSLALLSVALLFCLGAWFWGQCILVPFKLEKVILYATIFSAIVNIVLNIILIPIWKENAAALSTIISEAISFFWCMHYGKKQINIKGTYLLLVKVLGGCVAIVGVSCLLKYFSSNYIIYTVSTIILSIVIYAIIEIFLKNQVVIELLNRGVSKIKSM